MTAVLVPFQYQAHAVTIPVLVGDEPSRFVVDTGIGVNLVSGALAERAGCVPDGSSYTGRRMSGQPVTVPLGSLPVLRVGDHRGTDVPVGLLDLGALAGLDGIGGFLSLNWWAAAPVTFDYPAGHLVLEDEASLAGRAAASTPVPVRVLRDGPSVDVNLALRLPSGRVISAEVDTGSDTLVLDERFAADAGVDLAAPSTRRAGGQDETGHTFTRFFATARGDVCVDGVPAARQSSPEVMFQRIIHDGLVGDRFLRNFTVTYDLPRERMIFGVPG